MGRPSYDEFFLQMAALTATMGTCPRKQVGAVIVKGKDVLTIGFNGAPAGHPHCTEVGCLQIPGEGEGCHRTRHAEENAILKAVARGLDLRGATVYLTLSPCMNCAKRMVTEGISRVVYAELYRDDKPLAFLERAGVQTQHQQDLAGT
jgi:dCMP deaminase